MSQKVWMISNMSTNGKQENQNNHGNAEKLFRAMSGIDEELLARSEQSTADARAKRGKVHRFPVWKTSRIVAACLCFVVVGAVFVTVSTYGWQAGKSANSTGAAQSADMAVQNEAAAAPEEVLSAAAAADEDTLDGANAASTNSGDEQKQTVQQDAGNSDTVERSVSDNDSAAPGETPELREKAPRRPHRKMIKRTTRG